MKVIFFNIYKVLRTLIVMGIVTFVTVFVALYLILLIPSVQNTVKETAEDELAKLLSTDVEVEQLSISPFNKVVLKGVEVADLNGEKLLKVDKLGVGVSLYNLITRKRLVFTYAEIVGLNGNIYRESLDSPLNIQFIIDAFSPKDKNKPPQKFDLSIYNIVLRKSNITYDVLNEDRKENVFDKNHIAIKDLRADIALPLLRNDKYNVNIKRLSFKEQSGFYLKNFIVNTQVDDKNANIAGLRIELPQTYLALRDFSISYNSLNTLGKEIAGIDFNVNTTGSYITLSDLSCFVPQFDGFKQPIDLTIISDGNLKELELKKLRLKARDNTLLVDVNGVAKNVTDIDSLKFKIPSANIRVNAKEIAEIISNVAKISPLVKTIISNCGNIKVSGSLKGTKEQMYCQGKITTDNGQIKLDGNVLNNKGRLGYAGHVETAQFNVGKLLSKENMLGETSFKLNLNGVKSKSGVSAVVDGNIAYFDFKGYRYNDISADLDINPSEYSGSVTVNDKNIALSVDGGALLKGEQSKIDLDLNVVHCNLDKINISKKHPNHNMSFKVNALTSGTLSDNWNGRVLIEDFKYVDEDETGIVLDEFEVVADNTNLPYRIDVNSDVINGTLEGEYNLKSVVPALKNIISLVFPALFEKSEDKSPDTILKNDFEYTFNIENNDETNSLLSFFKSPVTLLYPITLTGAVKESNNTMNLDISAPYLAQKDKLIENSRVAMNIDSISHNMTMNVHTVMQTKKGKMSIDLTGNGMNNHFNTGVSWKVDRKEAFHGNVDLSLGLARVNETNKLMATIDVNPTCMVFNDTTWQIHNSRIGIYNKSIRVNDFKVTCDNQFIRINGKSVPETDENLEVELKNINLDYIFETLQINNVTFGGCATGKIVASDLISSAPKLETERFFVDDMTYNETLLGDADIKSFWNNEKKYVAIKALISQNNGCKSNVDGEIYPMRDSMRFDFDTEKLKVGFLKPFMSAITSDLDGYVSGHACLYGKFSTLNLYGDVYAEDLKVKVDYTNVYYWASDSIKIVPGLISFKDVQLKDRYGRTAKLSGHVSHEDFRNAEFDFQITDARRLLCYDIPEKRKDPWYGTIFGSGTTFVKGEPGYVGIDVRMKTEAGSKFFFELSDSQEAVEYDFITFTDTRRDSLEAAALAKQPKESLILKNFEERKNIASTSKGSRMVINIEADINPLGQLILIMDPAGGDKIKATGNGRLTLRYDTNENLYMSGNYILDKGTYNFTLQDIIVKDFTIKEGGSISFDGNPYAAKIDISAIYALNANLLDLDESFATDKEFNRTSVPVHALLNISGSIASPAINFDLEFPTLSTDAYRKVRSIVSTDDMMNRQIIYLLALNRFYTPEYMGGTNRNNELASVASSTLSSQLSNILGSISDNWQISPNFKSDKGDFSDVEVNLALSSQLLNNRLLLNGNFGYRDNMVAANNSNFIGDFDIEYLLNRAGNVRLKAYNHFNDQNYYVKNALTTQGVGVVFKFDFDNPFSSFKKKKQNLKTDSIRLQEGRIEKIDSIR